MFPHIFLLQNITHNDVSVLMVLSQDLMPGSNNYKIIQNVVIKIRYKNSLQIRQYKHYIE